MLHILQRPPNGAPTPIRFFKAVFVAKQGRPNAGSANGAVRRPLLGHVVESAVGRGNHRYRLLGGTDEVTD